MALSERTLLKLREESEQLGGRVYEEDQDAHEEDVTHFPEDDNPLSLVGEPEDSDAPVGEVPDPKGEAS